MTIDILLATYNGAAYLQDQVESLLDQTVQDFRLLVRDDGSTDETVSILHRYAPRFEGRMHVVPSEQTTLGATGNFAVLMALSSADYVMFCDQDDIWYPDKVAISLAVLQELERRNSRDFPLLVHCDSQVVDSELNILSPSFHKRQKLQPEHAELPRLLVQNVIHGCTVIINRMLADLACPVPVEARMHDSWLGLLASACGQIAFIDAPLMDYRRHEQNNVGLRSFDGRLDIRHGVRQKMGDNIAQAHALLARAGPAMEENMRKCLEAFIQLPHMPKSSRIATLASGRFLRRPLYQNLPVYLFY